MRISVLVVVGLVSIGATAWLLMNRGTTAPDVRERVFADYEVYPSLEALATEADLVVEAVAGPVVLREVDRGGDPEVDPETGEAIPGVPMAFYEFEVVDVLSNTEASSVASPPETILVALLDADVVSSEQETPFAVGDQLVLFLKHRNPESAPGLTPKSFYVPLSGDNGVFDVEGTTVTPRLPVVDRLRGFEVGSGPAASDSESFELADLAAVVDDIGG